MVEHFVHQMQSEFKTSLLRELTDFPGLQVKKMDDYIFISQSKYANSIVNKFGFDKASQKRTPSAKHVNYP